MMEKEKLSELSPIEINNAELPMLSISRTKYCADSIVEKKKIIVRGLTEKSTLALFDGLQSRLKRMSWGKE